MNENVGWQMVAGGWWIRAEHRTIKRKIVIEQNEFSLFICCRHTSIPFVVIQTNIAQTHTLANSFTFRHTNRMNAKTDKMSLS